LRYTILSILLILIIGFNFNTKAINNKEKEYKKISKGNYTVDEINNLLITYKDSLTIPNINIKKTAFFNLVISKLYYFLGAYNKSIDYGKVALSNYESIKDTAFMMYALINMGAIYGENNEDDIAFEYFSRIEKLALASNDSSALSYNYINMGNTFSDKDREKTLEYYKKAESFGVHKSIIFKISILNGRANVYFKQKKYDKALRIYLKALKLIDDKHFFYNSLCTNIAEAYKGLGNLDSALHYTYIALQSSKKFHSINNFANTYSLMTSIYLEKHNADSAKHYFVLFKNYNDSIILNKKIEYVSRLKVINETDKLLENNKIQKQKLIWYHLQLKYLLIVAFIILAALLVVFILYRKVKSSYRKIVKESVQSLKIEEEVIRLRQKLSINDAKNKNNGTNIENSDKIFYEIIKYLEEDKLYTDHDFTLNKLSELIGINRTYISNIINIKTGDSFVKLVNSYRVKEAKRMLIDEENKNYTLEAIGKISGFKSTSSFYRVFKIETGVTPSFYIKNKNN